MAAAQSFCFVVSQEVRPGAEVPGMAAFARDAARSGQHAHLLLATPRAANTFWERWCVKHGIVFKRLEDTPEPFPPAYGYPHELISFHVYRFLRNGAFAAICFEHEGGCGFHCIQAKRVLGLFEETCLVVLPAQSKQTSGAAQGETALAATRRQFCVQYCTRYADAVEWGTIPFSESQPGGRPNTAGGQATDKFPMISVCMAHYNHGRYLPQALASLAAQDYPNFEVIVMDDGSTDPETHAVFRRCRADFDSRFRFCEQVNTGPGPARNACAALARGELLLFMDADNIAMPHMLSTFYRAISRTGLDAITCHFTAFASDFTGNGMPQGLYASLPPGQDVLSGLLENVFGDTNMLVRADVYRELGGMRSVSAEDWDFLARLSLARYSLDVAPEPLFFYRLTSEGISRNLDPLEASRSVREAYRDVLGNFGGEVAEYLLAPLYFELRARRAPYDSEGSVLLRAAILAGTFLENRYQSLFPKGSRRQRFASWVRTFFSPAAL